MQVRYNVYEQAFRNKASGITAAAVIQPAVNTPAILTRAVLTQTPCVLNGASGCAPLGSAVCNRYEDGSFVEQQWFQSPGSTVQHVTTGCPDYP